jgi:FkbM family methyltransferase
MGTGKELLKTIIAKTCSPQIQHRIRRYYLARRVLAKHEFHEVDVAVLRSVIHAGDSVADIGANVGAYTNEFSRLVGENGRVHAFEPVAANYDILQAVIRKGRLRNVRSFRMALGAKVEQREIAVPDLGGFTGYYWAHFAKPGERGEKVEVSTLDEMLRAATVPRLDFIKCDVEGSEIEVIEGGLELMRRERPGWLLEVSRETSNDVFARFTSLGYTAFVYDGKLTPVERFRDKEFSNYFFFHPESKLWPRLAAVADAPPVTTASAP